MKRSWAAGAVIPERMERSIKPGLTPSPRPSLTMSIGKSCSAAAWATDSGTSTSGVDSAMSGLLIDDCGSSLPRRPLERRKLLA